MEDKLTRQTPNEVKRKQYGIKFDPVLMDEVEKQIKSDPDVMNRSQLIEDFLRTYVKRRKKFTDKMLK